MTESPDFENPALSEEPTLQSELSEPALETEWFQLLYKIGQELNSSLDIHTVMSHVLSLATIHLKADKGSIFLLDHQGEVSHQILKRRNLPSVVATKVVKSVLEKGLAGWVIRECRGAIVQDVRNDPRWLILPDNEPHPESVIAVPIVKDTKALGLIILHHPEVSFFSEQHLALLTAIANQSAVALENARLYAEQERIVEERTRTVVETTNFLRSVLDSAIDYAIIAVDSQGVFLTWNEGASRMFGYSAEEMVGKATSSILYGSQFLTNQSDNNLLNAILEAQKDSPRVSPLYFVRRNGQNFPVDIMVTRIRDLTGQPVGILGIIRDITEQIRLEEAKTQFVANVSHELRTPIAVLKLQLGNLLRHYHRLDDDTRLELLFEANAQSGYLQQLTEDILSISQIDTGTMSIQSEIFDLSQALYRLVTDFERTVAPQEVQFTWQGLDIPTPINGDQTRIAQVVKHLLNNALKFTAAAGQIHLRLAGDDENVQLILQDSGPAIPPDEHRRIFERFYRGSTTAPDKKGSGLGLAIAKQIIDAHGGCIEVASEEKKGNTFTITLPRGL